MSATSRSTSSLETILETALKLLDDGNTVTLDSVARAAGITKPGLMYHFSTKADMMDALVDHVVDSLEAALTKRLPGPIDRATAAERICAYVEWALTTRHRRSDLIMFSDPKLLGRMSARWADRFDKWVTVPRDAPPARRARLNAARMMADGVWLADTSATLPVAPSDRSALLGLAIALIEDKDPL